MVRWPSWGSCGDVKPTLGVQEHCRETQIDDVDLVKHDIVKNQRTPRGSGDQMALLGALVALLSPHWVLQNTVGRRRLMMLITKSKNTERYACQMAFLEAPSAMLSFIACSRTP